MQDILSFETTSTANVIVAVDFNLSNAGKQRENTINNINTAYGAAVENQMIAGEAKLITINYRLRSSPSGNDGGKWQDFVTHCSNQCFFAGSLVAYYPIESLVKGIITLQIWAQPQTSQPSVNHRLKYSPNASAGPCVGAKIEF